MSLGSSAGIAAIVCLLGLAGFAGASLGGPHQSMPPKPPSSPDSRFTADSASQTSIGLSNASANATADTQNWSLGDGVISGENCSNLTTFNSSLNYADNCTEYQAPGFDYFLPLNLSSPPPPEGPGPSLHNHWWYGVATTSSTTTNYVSTVIFTPQDLPASGDYYYAELSVFDDANTYDQIGITGAWSSVDGSAPTHTWYVNWVAASHCGSNFVSGINWDPFATALSYATYYEMSMTISLLTHSVTYSVAELPLGPTGYSYTVWTHTNYTGGSIFDIANKACNGNFDYTTYLEHYDTVQQDSPNWGIYFMYTQDGQSTSWTSMTGGSPPGNIGQQYGSNYDYIYDEAFSLNLTYYSWSLRAGTTFIDPGWSDLDKSSVCSSCTVTLSTLSVTPAYCAANLGVSFSPWTGTPYFTYNLKIVAPATISPNTCYVEMKGRSSQTNSFTTELVVIRLQATGGGGCVQSSTPIATPSGYVAISSLEVGSSIVGFNLSTNSSTTETVTEMTSTSGSQTYLSVNNGQFNVTYREQPIYVVNQTFTGWLMDPQNLTIGDLLFSPSTDTWIAVFSLVDVTASVTVYDMEEGGTTHDWQAGTLGAIMMSKHQAGGGI